MVDKIRAKSYFEAIAGKKLPIFKVNISVARRLGHASIESGCESGNALIIEPELTALLLIKPDFAEEGDKGAEY